MQGLLAGTHSSPGIKWVRVKGEVMGAYPSELYGHMHMYGVYIASDAINTNGTNGAFFFFSVYLGPLRLMTLANYDMPAWAASHHTVIIILSQYQYTST